MPFQASIKYLCQYHIVHSGIDRSTYVCQALKYSYTLHAKVRVSEPLLNIDSCVVKS